MSRATQRAILLSNAERNQVEALERVLEAGVPVLVSPAGERVELPVSVFEVLKEAVGFMSHGRGITVFPDDQVVTTQQAADVLGMSRPFLVKLLEHGAIAFHRVGNQRRLRLRDVQKFAKRRDRERLAALDRLARDAFDSGLYERNAIPEGGEDA